MLKKIRVLTLLPLVAAISSVWAQTVQEQELEPIVVTTASQRHANVVQLNTKTAIQPLPANDGAGVLLPVPNMSVIRKGGTSGDPLFRGLGGSRLAVQADDQFIYGGCRGRMDPPTAYIFPTAYDKVIVTKGPQTVTQGMGLVAGSVRFVRKEQRFDETNTHLNAAYTTGSFGRNDVIVDGSVGGRLGYARLNATYNTADDYKDGDGKKAHSSFERNSQMLQLGLTPTTNTVLAATYERSRAEAAYSDRMMDGSKFDRDAWNIRGVHRNITDWFTEAQFRYGQSEIDHVMDNYSLRSVPGKKEMTGNPKRNTDTAQFKTTFQLGSVELQTGLDYLRDKHAVRRTRGRHYTELPYQPTQDFKHWGAFAEANWQRSDTQNWIMGYRYDSVTAHYNPNQYEKFSKFHQKYTLHSGFLRLEQKIGDAQYYAGIGIAQRAPDFWERNRIDDLQPERNTQLDVGAIWQHDKWNMSASLFASRTSHFILVDVNHDKKARNVSASRLGGELEANYHFAPHWTVGGSLAYNYGKNRTDNLPLAQTPPLEWKTTLSWDNGEFSAGALWRVVAKQNRFAIGQGNIIGQDIGASAGFGVLSLNAGWRMNKNTSIQTGVDNVFNKTYAEFVNKTGNSDAGVQTMRVNEPGRQVWLRAQVQF